MSHDDSAVWRARAKAMRALVDTSQGQISKELLLRIAEDYERFAASIEERPDRFVPPEEVPLEVKQFGRRTPSTRAPSLVPEDEIPDFLKLKLTTAPGRSDNDGD